MTTWRPGQVITDAGLNARDLVGKVVLIAARTSVQTFTTGVAADISWPTPTLDTLGMYAAGTPTRFTPTVAGWYTIGGQLGMAANATGTRLALITKNGTGVGGAWADGFATDPLITALPSTAVYMNGTTDYLSVNVYQTSGGNLNTGTGAAAPAIMLTYAGA